MLTCSNCGATIREGAKFCTSCGTRLNDTSNEQTTNVWAVPEPAAVSTVTTADPANEDTVVVDSAQEPNAATAEATAESGGFSWSWGTPMAADPNDSGDPPQGDDESGTVLAGDDTDVATAGETISDATELEILDDQPSTSDEVLIDGVTTPDLGATINPDSSAVIDDATADPSDDEPAAELLPDDERGDTDTLAAWAGEWESSEAPVSQDDEPEVLDASGEEEPEPVAEEEETDIVEDDSVTEVGTETEETVAEAETATETEEEIIAEAETATEEGNETEALVVESELVSEAETDPVAFDADIVPLVVAAKVSSATAAEESGDAGDADDEDTVARAERLIGELKAIIPTLVRPRPALPAKDDDATQTVADDLDSAARIGQFDDVREALLAARDNPRDVDNMLRLSNNVDRLLELLDDRNNLAKTATSAAGRLRKTTSSTVV